MQHNTKQVNKTKIAVVMTGGGARAAYQVGVMRAIVDMRPKNSPCPFNIISGTSAGAINAVSLAIASDHFQYAVMRMNHVWRNFTADQVFCSNSIDMVKMAAKFLGALVLGSFGKNKPLYILDRKPLRHLLSKYINPDDIQKSIDSGYLHAIGVSASGYVSGQSVTFYQGHHSLKKWTRARRVGCRENITIDHLMASSAIPFLFAPIKINREYFGDGSMRQMAPLSASLHLGAERVLVIGNRNEDVEPQERIETINTPNLAQIAGHALNSIFLDSLEADLERLERINNTVNLIPENVLKKKNIGLRNVESLLIAPSKDLGDMAKPFIKYLPISIRILLRGIGAGNQQGSSFVSYLMFEKSYCRALIRLGYRDAMQQREQIEHLLRND